MNDAVMLHIDEALAQVRALFMKAATRIEAIKPGEKIPATQLAEDLAKEQGLTGPQLYPILKQYLLNQYPGVDIRRGAHGGIFRLPAVAAVVDKPVSDANDGNTSGSDTSAT